MKKILILLSCILSLTSCKQKSAEVKVIETIVPEKVELNQENLVKNELKITGMTCAIGCAAAIQKKLNSTPGIESAVVDFESSIAQIVFDPNFIQEKALDTIVKSVGDAYTVIQNERVTSFKDLSSK